MNINQKIDEIVYFAQSHLLLDDLDVVYTKNLILNELKLDLEKKVAVNERVIDEMTSIDSLLNPLLDYATTNGIVKVKDRQRLSNKICIILSKRPLELADLYLEQRHLNQKKADEWLVDYMKKSNFVTFSSLNEFVEEVKSLKVKPSKSTPPLVTNSNSTIEGLIAYTQTHLMLDDYDVSYIRYRLIEEFNLSETAPAEIDLNIIDELLSPATLLEQAAEEAKVSKVIKAGEEVIFMDKIMGILSRRPSEIIDIFNSLHFSSSAKFSRAFEWLFDYAVKSNYTAITKVSKNRHFEAKATKGRLEVTVNMLKLDLGGCEVCIENEGSEGKNTLRIIPIKLGGEQCYFQFAKESSVVQHGLVAVGECEKTLTIFEAIEKSLEMAEFMPSYFCAFDSDDIKSHLALVSGKNSMPLFKVQSGKGLIDSTNTYIKALLVDWYLPTIRLTYTNKKILAQHAEKIITAWEKSKKTAKAIAAARKAQDGTFTVDVVLVDTAVKLKSKVISQPIDTLSALGTIVLDKEFEENLQMIERFATKEKRYSEQKLTDKNRNLKGFIEKVLDLIPSKASEFEAKLNVKEQLGLEAEKYIIENSALTSAELIKFLVGLSIAPYDKNSN